jgi:hypothetical protein
MRKQVQRVFIVQKRNSGVSNKPVFDGVQGKIVLHF